MFSKFRTLFVITLALCATVHAAYDPLSNDVIQFGGAISGNGPNIIAPATGATGYFTLEASVNAVTAGNFLVVYKSGQPYQVPSGKTFLSSEVWTFGSLATDALQLCTGSTVVSTNDTATPPSNPVYYMGASVRAQYIVETALTWKQFRLPITFGPTSFPCVQTTGTNGSLLKIRMIGREFP